MMRVNDWYDESQISPNPHEDDPDRREKWCFVVCLNDYPLTESEINLVKFYQEGQLI